jgi:hypothetical protein
LLQHSTEFPADKSCFIPLTRQLTFDCASTEFLGLRPRSCLFIRDEHAPTDPNSANDFQRDILVHGAQ